MIIRKQIIFTGRVQGVGFRWRARMAAEELGLTGWIRNNWDDSVEMEVQGEEAAIDRMLAQIDAGSFIRIEEMRTRRLKPDPHESRFRVIGY